jgi:hypothetical protein
VRLLLVPLHDQRLVLAVAADALPHCACMMRRQE